MGGFNFFRWLWGAHKIWVCVINIMGSYNRSFLLFVKPWKFIPFIIITKGFFFLKDLREMFLRQALLGGLFRRRRIRFPDQTFIASIIRTTTPTTTNASSSSYTRLFSYQCDDSGYSTWKKNHHHRDTWLWILLSGQAAVILGINGNLAFAEDASDEFGTGTGEISSTGLRRIEDGSVVSNSHTSKWRIFTDKGREYFLQGKHVEAEKFFSSALQEAKEGFGERDPHVASACNNLAELYRVRKAFDKAEPLYLEAVNILEESFGPEDIRLGAALHNLGQFYLVQRKLEKARVSYERALKIKGRVLGHFHTDYADTMFHLGTVMYLLGKEKDAIALVKDSIRILEEAGQGESNTCLRRLRYLAQIYLKSNQITEAENVQRKILHVMEVSKGSNSLDTVVAAEELALTLQANCSLKEAQELLEWCLGVRKTMLPEDHIQIGANMLHMARVAMLSSNRLSKVDNSEAKAELDKAKDLLHNSIRIAERVLDSPKQNQSNMQTNAKLKESGKDDHAALVILLQSLDTLGLLEITKQELDEPKKGDPPPIEAEHAFRQCIAAFKESKTTKSLSDSPEVKAAYLSCLKHLLSLMSETTIDRTHHSRRNTLQELKDEIKHVEAQLSQNRKLKN